MTDKSTLSSKESEDFFYNTKLMEYYEFGFNEEAYKEYIKGLVISKDEYSKKELILKKEMAILNFLRHTTNGRKEFRPSQEEKQMFLSKYSFFKGPFIMFNLHDLVCEVKYIVEGIMRDEAEIIIAFDDKLLNGEYSFKKCIDSSFYTVCDLKEDQSKLKYVVKKDIVTKLIENRLVYYTDHCLYLSDLENISKKKIKDIMNKEFCK